MQQEDCFATSWIDMIQAIVFLSTICWWIHLVLELCVDQTQRLSVGFCISACQYSRSLGPQLHQGTACACSGNFVCAGWVMVVMPGVQQTQQLVSRPYH